MRKYVRDYLNSIDFLSKNSNVDRSLASMTLKAIEKASTDRANYFVSGLTKIDSNDVFSCVSKEYLSHLLETLSGLEPEALQGAIERNESLLRLHTEMSIYAGKLVVFDDEVDQLLDDYLQRVSSELDVGSFAVINRVLNEVKNDNIPRARLTEALQYNEIWELVQDSYKYLSDNDDPQALIMTKVINTISEAESKAESVMNEANSFMKL